MPIPLVKAARRYLIDSGVLADLVGTVIGQDPVYPDGWIFSGDIDGFPFRPVEGKGKVSVVLFSNDTWSPSTHLHTAKYPLLRVTIYADVDRNVDGTPAAHNADDKVSRVYDLIHPLFHDAANRVRKFDDLHVVSTVEGSALNIMEVPNGDGAVMGAATYEVTLL